jgi:hypothetical protein
MNKIDNIACHATVSEKVLEPYLVRSMAKVGAVALKYYNPWAAGYPDRLVLMPQGKVVWVELKSRGKTPNRLQLSRHIQLRELGFDVRVIDNKEDIDKLRDEIQSARLPKSSR